MQEIEETGGLVEAGVRLRSISLQDIVLISSVSS
jgi:hypothetical protein